MADTSVQLAAAQSAPRAPPVEPAGPSRLESLTRRKPRRPASLPESQTIYLSNDDSMSLSSAQRIETAIEQFLPIPRQHLRPHEFLNYFHFETKEVAEGKTFSVRADLVPGMEPGTWTLGLAVAGRRVSRTERCRATITLVIDVSGSMSGAGKMDYLKRGLKRMAEELRPGDMVNLVEFDNQVFVPLENFVVGRDDSQLFIEAVDALRPRGGTNLHAGLNHGYLLAERYFNSGTCNKIILITDARTNRGVTSKQMISEVGRQLDARGIELSGVGVGRYFNDSLLDRLTEKGRGAYLFLGSPRAAERVFGEGFVSLLETVARDVRFKLVLPPSLRMKVFYGEEASTVKQEVKAIHYFAGTTQLFLSDLEETRRGLEAQDVITLEAEFLDPRTGDPRVESFAFSVGGIRKASSDNVGKARALMAFTDMLRDLAPHAQRRIPSSGRRPAEGWEPPKADSRWAGRCQDGLRRVEEQLAAASRIDHEHDRIRELASMFCLRFGEAAIRTNRFAPPGRE